MQLCLIVMLMTIGKAQSFSERIKQAKSNLNFNLIGELISELEELGVKDTLALAVHTRGSMFMLSNLDSAIAYTEDALRIRQSLDRPNYCDIGASLFNLVFFSRKGEDPDRAISYAKKLFDPEFEPCQK